MSDLKKMAALTALNKMMRDSYFSICTFDNAAKLLGIHPPAEQYAILRTLHCVDWAAMPSALRDSVPRLINECLNVEPAYQFGQPRPPAPVLQLVNVTPLKPVKTMTFLTRLFGH